MDAMQYATSVTPTQLLIRESGQVLPCSRMRPRNLAQFYSGQCSFWTVCAFTQAGLELLRLHMAF
ncbi:hypothetical protein DPMN_101885 [Dreissena polymorpha]|uniref:Uncharacterized protein n=1 Tax=Dreissena polymorpha TaxID=45954 RepID=A0A9D4R8N4_DREPO|nr:hypothetical protein DPMN_101885 [Dreissena polymorpha]